MILFKHILIQSDDLISLSMINRYIQGSADFVPTIVKEEHYAVARYQHHLRLVHADDAQLHAPAPA